MSATGTGPTPFAHELRVRYGECDPQGIVFNANYLLYFDVAFTELWRAAVGPWQEMVGRGFDAVVAEARLNFRAPARYDDVLRLDARVMRLGNSAITTEIDVMRGEELLVAGVLRHVCVSTETWLKTEMPGWVRGGLERFLVPTAEPEHASDLQAPDGA
ncbi:MAG TPA: thioesterase family protein [Solirubrobacteraceae bacterium]|jgi:acyl-CoA thioester hydrolase|nr:thioesterase family protein [Solirubrobacteraceae bacterium]